MRQSEIIDVTFGKWIQREREQKGLTIDSLSKKSGVDASTISRIENDKTLATLQTAINICGGLNTSLTRFTDSQKAGYVPSSSTSIPREVEIIEDYSRYKSLLKSEDVRNFVVLDQTQNNRTRRILAGLMRDVFRGLENKHEERTSTAWITRSSFSPTLLVDYYPIFRIEPLFPSELERETIWETYQLGGKLTQFAIDTYIYKRMIQWLEFRELGRSERRLLDRLRNGAIDRIKLMEAVKLDIDLKEDLTGMAWNARRIEGNWIPTGNFDSYDTKILRDCMWPMRMSKLVAVFVALCWWRYSVQQGTDDEWLVELRSKIYPDS